MTERLPTPPHASTSTPWRVRCELVRETGLEPATVRHAAEAASIFRQMIADRPRECFAVLGLSASGGLIYAECVSVGTATAALVHPREVFQAAILAGACAIITGHNHPGGTVEPSEQDMETWERLDEAGGVLGIACLDHLIVLPHSGRYYSKTQHDSPPE